MENLDELVADYQFLRYEQGVAWDLDEKLQAVYRVVDGLGQRSDADTGTDLQRIRRRLEKAARLYWLTFTLFLIGIALAIGSMIAEFVKDSHAFSFWWFAVPFIFLIPVGIFGERKRRLEATEMFFEEYPRQRQLALRQVNQTAVAAVDVQKLWSQPGQLERSMFYLRVFHRFKNREKSDLASAHGVHKALSALSFSVMPLIFRSPDDGLWQMLIIAGFLLVAAVAYWAMTVADTVRELLAQTGPPTLTQLVMMEQEYPGIAADPEAENKDISHEATALAFKKEVEWLARLARRTGRTREPDYRMCLELERPSLRWSIVSILLLLIAIQRMDSATQLDWIVLPLLIAWMSFHIYRSTRLHGVRMQFEKFGRQNLGEIVPVDSAGNPVSWRRSGKTTWRSWFGMEMLQDFRRSSQARSQS